MGQRTIKKCSRQLKYARGNVTLFEFASVCAILCSFCAFLRSFCTSISARITQNYVCALCNGHIWPPITLCQASGPLLALITVSNLGWTRVRLGGATPFNPSNSRQGAHSSCNRFLKSFMTNCQLSGTSTERLPAKYQKTWGKSASNHWSWLQGYSANSSLSLRDVSKANLRRRS